MRPSISLVIPIYNEAESLPLLYEKITATLADMPHTAEIIFIDDGSVDGSAQILHDLHAQDSRVVVGIQRRNFGKSVALLAGFTLANGDILITLDSDLQDEPAEIPNLLQKLDEGYDLVTGWKKNRQDPLTKRLPSKIANSITSAFTGLHLNDMNSGLKALRAEAAKNLDLYGELHRYIPVMVHMQGFRVTEIPVVHHARQYGHSKYGAGRLLRGGFDFLTVLFLNHYGTRPLHFFGTLGSLLFISGVGINIFLSIEWIVGNRPIGTRPLLQLGVLFMLMGGQLLTIGLVAEMITSLTQQRTDPLQTMKAIHANQTQELNE